jgi:hypothetical protein
MANPEYGEIPWAHLDYFVIPPYGYPDPEHVE